MTWWACSPREMGGWFQAFPAPVCPCPGGDGSWYLADGVLGEVWLWDTATGALLYRQPLDMPLAWSVAFHPIEPLLVVGGNSNDLPVMDVRARRITSDALLPPDGTWVAWGQGDMSVGLWTPERDSTVGA